KLSFAKLYKPFDWVIGTGIHLDDLDELISLKKHQMKEDFNRDKNILIIVSLVSILLIVIIVGYFQYHIKKLILSYEGKIDDYTKELEAMATTDQLTGLCNRLELDNIYSKELAKAARYDKVFSIIMIDLDYFKSVNDTYGHQVGDSVLKELSHILQSSIREVDTVGRWGGEEFLIICPQTNLDGALKLAEHIRVAIEYYDFDVAGRKTSSFGVGTYHENDTQDSMIERADNALYCAKEEGRNAVRAEIYKL
ncbi:MAG: diguanylate cyclase, partial [Sulfurimonas sp.]|nr:diguanylate cyclase [Sulfurimonas sp.]